MAFMNEFTEVMKENTDQQLIDIVYFHSEEYQEKAVEAANEELKNRGIDNPDQINKAIEENVDNYYVDVVTDAPQDVSDDGFLSSVNGIGTMFKGRFRETTRTYVTYRFFCFFFLPIIPLGCYRVAESDICRYRIYGVVEYVKSEIYQVYLWWYGPLAVLVALFLIISFILK